MILLKVPKIILLYIELIAAALISIRTSCRWTGGLLTSLKAKLFVTHHILIIVMLSFCNCKFIIIIE